MSDLDHLPLSLVIEALKRKRWVDLTHTITESTPVYHAFERLRRRTLFSLEQDGFHVEEVTFATASGTHIDAPGHFIAGRRKLDGLASDALLLPLVVVHQEEAVESNPDYRLSVDDLLEFEAREGAIAAGSFVAFASGWSRRWPDGRAFANQDEAGQGHTPGWSLEALKYLFETRGISAVGHETLDTDAAIDVARNGDLIAERYVLDRDAWQVEVLNNLAQLPATGAYIHVSYPNFGALPSCPVRAIAYLP